MIFRNRPESRPPASPPAPLAAPPRPAPTPAPAPARTGTVRSCYTLVFGQKGMGKTTYMVAVYLAAIRGGRSGTFIDSKGEYGHLGRIVRTPAEWAAHVAAARRDRRPFNLVVQPSWDAELAPLWRLIYEAGDVLLAIDEADGWAPSSGAVPPELVKLIGWGRSKRVDMLTTVRLYSEIHGTLKGAADVVVTFRQPDAYYAEAINKRWFNLADPSLITRLPEFTYLRMDVGARKIERGRTRPPP